jgi:hypothetical protein
VPLNFFKDLFLLLYPYDGFPFSLLCGFKKGFFQNRVIGEREVCGDEGLVDEYSTSFLSVTMLVIIYLALDLLQWYLEVGGFWGRG